MIKYIYMDIKFDVKEEKIINFFRNGIKIFVNSIIIYNEWFE